MRASIWIPLTTLLSAIFAVAADAKEAPSSAPFFRDSEPISKGVRQYSMAVVTGYGFGDLFNLGFGVRGGSAPLQSDPDVFLGFRFMYYLGSSLSGGGEAKAWLVAPELGYAFMRREALTVRPYLALGVLRSSRVSDLSAFGFPALVPQISTDFALIPGVALNIDHTKTFYGVDLNVTFAGGYGAIALDIFYGWKLAI